MNSSLVARFGIVVAMTTWLCLSGCSRPTQEPQPVQETPPSVAEPGTPAEKPAPTGRESTAAAEDVQAAQARLDALGTQAQVTIVPDQVLTGIVIRDGSNLTAEDIALFGRLTDLETLQIYNFREMNDAMVANLKGLRNLVRLAITNSVITDASVETIAREFPDLKELDLSSNTLITSSVMRVIAELTGLERLTLIQNNFNDLSTTHLSKLQNLRALDLRGNMEAGDMTLEVVGQLPRLVSLRHRTTTVTDFGMESLSNSQTLDSLLIQDFMITSMSGEHLAKLENLTQLEIFRCQGFGSEGVQALAGRKLTRLTLRDLPMVDDSALQVLPELPHLRRLYLHELASVSDFGLENLAALQSLELLDIWEVPQMSDATIEVIASLPNLKQLSIRTTGVTDAAIDKLLEMPNLESLTFKENGMVTAEGLKKLGGKKFRMLDVGPAGGS
jgi:hypothetical protein